MDIEQNAERVTETAETDAAAAAEAATATAEAATATAEAALTALREAARVVGQAAEGSDGPSAPLLPVTVLSGFLGAGKVSNEGLDSSTAAFCLRSLPPLAPRSLRSLHSPSLHATSKAADESCVRAPACA